MLQEIATAKGMYNHKDLHKKIRERWHVYATAARVPWNYSIYSMFHKLWNCGPVFGACYTRILQRHYNDAHNVIVYLSESCCPLPWGYQKNPLHSIFPCKCLLLKDPSAFVNLNMYIPVCANQASIEGCWVWFKMHPCSSNFSSDIQLQKKLWHTLQHSVWQYAFSPGKSDTRIVAFFKTHSCSYSSHNIIANKPPT